MMKNHLADMVDSLHQQRQQQRQHQRHAALPTLLYTAASKPGGTAVEPSAPPAMGSLDAAVVAPALSGGHIDASMDWSHGGGDLTHPPLPPLLHPRRGASEPWTGASSEKQAMGARDYDLRTIE